MIERFLDSCRHLEEHPHLPAQARVFHDNTRLLWKDTIRFSGGHVLTAREHATFEFDGGPWIARNFTYDFRRANNSLVFRIDTHGNIQPIHEPCHVHVPCNEDDDGDDNRIELGNPIPIDFKYAMRCIERYFSGQPQDWEKANG